MECQFLILPTTNLGAKQNDPPPFFASAVVHARRFFLDLAPSSQADLVVVCGGYEDCQADYSIVREGFPYYSIELVARGRGEVQLGRETVSLVPGSLFTYGPEIPHRIRTDAQDPLGKYFVDFAGAQASSIFDDLEVPIGSHTHIGSLPEVQLLFNELIRDGRRADEFSQPLCIAILRSLVLRAAAYRSTPGGEGPEPYETYQRCVEYITANAHRLVSQQAAATECGVSPAYLSRLFKRHGRLSPYQFLLRLRMNLAAERLQDTDHPVRQIAEELGYRDPFHFSRAFKATLGVSPSAFRQLR